MHNPTGGVDAGGPLGDPRWPAGQGWQEMEQTVEPGGRGGPVTVHYNYNAVTGDVDDFKIVGRRPYKPKREPSVSPAGRE